MQPIPLFHRAYGDALARLPAPIVRVHDIRRDRIWHGEARIVRGTSLAARAICGFFRLPPTGDAIPLDVVMTLQGPGEIWTRHFGKHRMISSLALGAAPGTVEETSWPVTGVSRLDADAEGVTQVLVDLRVFGLRLPRLFWPKLAVREGAAGDRYQFSVAIALPWGSPSHPLPRLA